MSIVYKWCGVCPDGVPERGDGVNDVGVVRAHVEPEQVLIGAVVECVREDKNATSNFNEVHAFVCVFVESHISVVE